MWSIAASLRLVAVKSIWMSFLFPRMNVNNFSLTVASVARTLYMLLPEKPSIILL